MNLADVRRKIDAFDRETGDIDVLVMLHLHRADLLGTPLTMDEVAEMVSLSDGEIRDVFARLTEHGAIEGAE